MNSKNTLIKKNKLKHKTKTKKKNKNKKIRPSSCHNYQKHLINALQCLIVLPTEPVLDHLEHIEPISEHISSTQIVSHMVTELHEQTNQIGI